MMSSMNGQKEDKLKRLIETVPPGFLVDTRTLTRWDISRQLSSNYVRSGWLEHPLHGLYRRPFTRGHRPNAEREWKIPVLSAQWIMHYSFHVAATTALELHGYSHYLRLSGPGKLYVHGTVPTWLSRLALEAELVHRQGSLFGDETLGVENTDFSIEDTNSPELGESPWLWPMRQSSPERALLETLDEVPRHETFHLMDVMFQSMTNVRPTLMMQLLQSCRSIKTKRLFFAFADRHAHAWRKYLNHNDVDLGTGDRMLVEGGKLHPTYRITMPAEFVGSEAGNGA